MSIVLKVFMVKTEIGEHIIWIRKSSLNSTLGMVFCFVYAEIEKNSPVAAFYFVDHIF